LHSVAHFSRASKQFLLAINALPALEMTSLCKAIAGQGTMKF
jgi:hypothetical protein